jgi:hypothetical protein
MGDFLRERYVQFCDVNTPDLLLFCKLLTASILLKF